MPRHSYDMYGNGSAKAQRPPPGINVRQEWINRLRAGQTAPMVGGQNDRTYPGAPARTGRSPKGTTTQYLQQQVADMMAPLDAGETARRQARGRGVRQPDWTAKLEVLDPDELTAEVFALKKVVLAHEMERKLLKAEIQRLERDSAKLEQVVKDQGEELMGTTGSSLAARDGGARSQTHLIVNLKQTIRGLRRELDATRRQRDEVEASVKCTDIEELTLVAKANFEEVQRLQLVLQSESTEGADGADAEGEYALAGTGVRPTAQAFLRLENENRWLKEENTELQSDLSKALEAAQALTSKLRAPPVAAGDERKYDGMEKPDLVKKVVEMENQVVLLQAELAGLHEKVSQHDEADDAAARKMGLKSMKEALSLKESIASLRAENRRLLKEAQESVDAAAAAGLATAQTAGPKSTLQESTGLLHSTRKVESEEGVVYQSYRPDSDAPIGHDAEAMPTQAASKTQPLASILAPPTVPDAKTATTEAGRRLEDKAIRTAKTKHDRWVKENEADINVAITEIQRAIRGHFARQAINKQLRDDTRLD
mmetsp:Transcript_23782/g.62190  ORF Transcript_23782/g.62190 Transcript_23782/m.62190 type:complete len:541 (+) Transcript_23782:223-1845(+)